LLGAPDEVLHQAVKDNVAVPVKAAVEGQAGLSQGSPSLIVGVLAARLKYLEDYALFG
jgi:hypothetical protein